MSSKTLFLFQSNSIEFTIQVQAPQSGVIVLLVYTYANVSHVIL